eukprot:366318-Chlamydomonas_euryale.AAC.6
MADQAGEYKQGEMCAGTHAHMSYLFTAIDLHEYAAIGASIDQVAGRHNDLIPYFGCRWHV